MKTSAVFKFITKVILPLLAVMGFTINAQAAPLNLTLLPFPGAIADAIQVDYVAGTGTLSASGSLVSINDGFSTHPVFGIPVPGNPFVPGSFSLTANIDNTGALSSGTFTTFGNAPTVFPLLPPSTLMQGNIIDFGFSGSGSVLEFEVMATSGVLSAWTPPGASGGILLNFSGFGGSFLTDFSNSGQGVADLAPLASVPLPPAMFLFIPALFSLLIFRRELP